MGDDDSIDDTEDFASMETTDSGSFDNTESDELDTTANTDDDSEDDDDETDDSEDDDDETDTDSETDTDTEDETDEEADDEEEEDICVGLIESDCDDVTDEDGDMECAYNAISGDCYGIERRQGRFGAGNFDDGFIAAQEEAEKESSGLYAVIGVLGGIIGIMMIVMAFGGYYVWSMSNNGHSKVATVEMTDASMGQTINIENDQTNLMGS